MDPELVEKQKYAKWKASDISSALKQGRNPISGDLHRPKEVPPPDASAFPSIPAEEQINIIPSTPTESSSSPTIQQKDELTAPQKKVEEPQKPKEEELIPLTYTQEPYDTMGVSPECIDDAHKYARYAVSALQFEDRPNAIVNLTHALNCLGVTLPSQY